MATKLYSSLIKPSFLRTLLESKVPVSIFDASYNIPGTTGDPFKEHISRRIPGAKFFEIDEIADKSSGFPHMMPTNAIFESFMRRLNQENDDELVVCYDRLGMLSAPRAWFTFLAFGKKNVAVLDGGLPRWMAEGHPVESGEYQLYQDQGLDKDKKLNFKLNHLIIKGIEQVKTVSDEIVSNGKTKFQILDARPAGRFKGSDPEPRKGVRCGNIPGSINHFFKNNFKQDGSMKSPEELRGIFEKSH
jgi:thiosulfate/3-mercaptopyruvate sulfurtransferase